jgi:hypothetical protein
MRDITCDKDIKILVDLTKVRLPVAMAKLFREQILLLSLDITK